MPEAATFPAGAAAPPASGGTSTLMDDLETQLGPGAANASGDDGTAGASGEGAPAGAADPAKPAAGAPAGQAAPPAGQQPPKAAQAKQTPAAKPAAKPAGTDPNKEKDPVALRKRLQEVETELATFKGTAAQEKASLEAQKAELEKKRYWTPEDEQRNKAIQDRLQQVEASFFARDYAESPEFKDKFEKPWQARHQRALADVKIAKIHFKEDGEDKVRDAVAMDWFRVLNAGSDYEATLIANDLFGAGAQAFLNHRMELNRLKEGGEAAISDKRTGFDTERKTAFESFQRSTQAFQQQRESFTQALVQKYPAFFGEDGASEEEKTALKTGMEFVQSSLAQQGTLTPEDHAKRAAVMALYAGAFPRLVVTNKSLVAQIETLKADLAKYQKTDPGNAGEGGGTGGGGPSGTPGGTAGLMAAFDAIPKE